MNNKPFTPSRWVALSCLQKSIRRNNPDSALRAARQLHATEPANLLRRLKTVAVEDIGCGDLLLVHRVLTTDDSAWPVVEELITALCASVKDRSATDLSEAVSTNLNQHALAVEAAKLIKARHSLSDNPLAQEVAQVGYQVTRQPLCFAIPLVAGMAGDCANWQTNTYTTLPLIHGLPSATFDKYTREGTASYRRALKYHPTLRAYLEQWIAPKQVAEALGYIMFAVESGQLDRSLVYPGSDEVLRLGHQADVCRFGIPISETDAVMATVQEALPFIHQARCEVLHFTHHNHLLWGAK